MCGRYAATANPGELVLEFEIERDASGEPSLSVLVNPQDPPAGTPDRNLAPTKQAPVVLTRVDKTGEQAGAPVRQLRLLTWGLVPSWAKDTRGAARLINARAETVASAPTFAKALATRRCLVPAAGWYEWQPRPAISGQRAAKQPYYMSRADGRTLAMAGIYEWWRDPRLDGDDPAAWVSSFSIITVAAEADLAAIHDRQPLVLERADWQRWLDPAAASDSVADLLDPAGRLEHRFAAAPIAAVGEVP